MDRYRCRELELTIATAHNMENVIQATISELESTTQDGWQYVGAIVLPFSIILTFRNLDRS